MAKVFLGGTCNNTTWREKLIGMLKIDYFNPVVDDWTPECMVREKVERNECDFCLYVITPSMTGVYSIAEVIDDSNKRPEKTIFCILEKDVEKNDKTFTKSQLKSLHEVGRMVLRNGGEYFRSLEEVATHVNIASYLHTKSKNTIYYSFDKMMELLKLGNIMRSNISDRDFRTDGMDYYYRSSSNLQNNEWKMCELDEGLFTSGEVQGRWKIVNETIY